MSLHPDLIPMIAGLYNTTPGQLKMVEGGHFSTVFEYKQEGKGRILRVTPPNPDIDLGAMRSILAWMDFLSTHDGPVPRLVRSQNGNPFEVIAFEGETYLASVFERAPGILAEGMALESWSDELFQALGKTLGRCHQIAGRYSPVAQDQRPTWDRAVNCFNPIKDLEDADVIILDKRSAVMSKMEGLPKAAVNFGLAHMDLHFGNFFVDIDNKQFTLIDFDDCAYGWYMMDIAMLLFDVLVVYSGENRLKFGRRFLENILLGYYTHTPTDVFWIYQLPHFLKLVEIGVYLMLYRDYDPESTDEWVGKFMAGRRERILGEIPYVELDFEDVYNSVVMQTGVSG